MHIHTNSYIRFGLLAISVCLLLQTLTPTARAGEQEYTDLTHAVVVIVNSHKITQRQFDNMAIFLFKQQYPTRKIETIRPDEIAALETRALRELIIQRLIEDDADEAEITASARDVDQHAGFMNVDLSNPETRETARRWVRSKIYFNKLMAKRGLGPPMPRPIDVRKFYKENQNDLFVTKRMVKVRHILIPAGTDPETQRKKANIIYGMLKKQPAKDLEEFFSQTAKEFSSGRFKTLGGLLRLDRDPEGWFPQHIPPRKPDGELLFPDALSQGIRGLIRPGQLSEIIQSELGFHILYLIDARGGQKMSFRDAQVLITRHLEQTTQNDRIEKWLKGKLEDRSTIISWHNGDPYPHENILPPEEEAMKTTRAAAEDASTPKQR